MSQPHENETIVRFSGAWWSYIITRAGLLRAMVNSVEDSLAVSGRFLLLTYLFYLGAQVGALLIAPNFSWPLPLEMGMFVLQIAGLEGSIPGLSRQAEVLRTEKEDEKQAKKVENVMLSARIMTICAFGEGAAYALGLDHQILRVASAILMVARGVVITGFLIELAKIEKRAPRVISRATHRRELAEEQERVARAQDRERAEHEREMARLVQPIVPHAEIEAMLQLALLDQAKQYDLRFNQLAEQQRSSLAELASNQGEKIDNLSTRVEQVVNVLHLEQQRLFTTVQEVKDAQQPRSSVDSKEEVINSVVERLQTLFGEQRVTRQTRQDIATINSREKKSAHRQTPKQHLNKQSVQTANAEISKRPKRIDPAAVDAVVHPLLDKDHSLTHRKIAAMPGVSYTETVVYASVKRWREAQPAGEGDSEESEVS